MRVKIGLVGSVLVAVFAAGATKLYANDVTGSYAEGSPSFGRIEITTIPFDADLGLRSATYTSSGNVLVSYAGKDTHDPRDISLAAMNDDGKNVRPFFSQRLPETGKINDVRFMVFADNKRIFLGDFVIECTPSIDVCTKSATFPVEYPAEVAAGDDIERRWSEIIVAPDNRHVAWTTLLSHFSAIDFVGELQKERAGYRIVNPRIISTLKRFRKDPVHPDGVLPNPVRGGEVKQFVQGGTAISLVGSVERPVPGSVVQSLATGHVEAITDTPGYTETTIFSPDERLGITMTTRFSPRTDPAILGLMPRPYSASLEMALSMYAYTYGVTGVRGLRGGNIGPALIDIQASKTQANYLGANLNTQEDWVFCSPMSWNPSGKKAMWIERQRDTGLMRIQVASLLDYQPGPSVTAKPFVRDIPYSSTDMSMVAKYAATSGDIDVKVFGRTTGYIKYRRTLAGVIEKQYVDFSDDGQEVYTGTEKMEEHLQGNSTYTATLNLSGPKSGVMDLKITFGPLVSKLPAQIIFEPDPTGTPMTHGYVEYDGKRVNAEALLP